MKKRKRHHLFLLDITLEEPTHESVLHAILDSKISMLYGLVGAKIEPLVEVKK